MAEKTRLLKKKETLEGVKRYHRLLLTPAFANHLGQRKKKLEEKIYHLRYIAQDCQDWKSSDLEAIKRGMEISILKYRLAKELAQEAREVLDDMMTDVYPYLTDPRGLEEKVWEVFDDEELSENDETERNEALDKLKVAGFELSDLPPAVGQEPTSEMTTDLGNAEIDELLNRETQMVQRETEDLLEVLRDKKAQLDSLRELDESESRSPSDAESA